MRLRAISLIVIGMATAAAAQAPEGHRYINLVANADRALQHDYRFGWYQAESVTKDVDATYLGIALDPSQVGRSLEWVMTSAQDANQEYFRQVATVHGGRWRFDFAPTGTAFAAGTYAGYVRTYMLDSGGAVTQNIMVAREVLTVLRSPGWENVPVIGPITSTNYIRYPDVWPDGHLLSRSNGVPIAVPPPTGGGTGTVDTAGLLTTNDFADTTSVTWSSSNGVMRATAQSSWTLLKKSGISLTGTYQLGPGLSVEDDVIDAAIDEDAYMATPLGTASSGRAPVWLPSPYETAVWRDVASFSELPANGDPQVVWFNPDTGSFFLSQPYAYYQGPMSTNNISIGTNVAIFAEIGTNTFIVPPGVTMLQVKGWGQAGHNGNTATRGGYGGYVNGYLPVTAGESLTIIVPGSFSSNHRQGGYPGGGSIPLSSTTAGAGGGAGQLWRGTNLLTVVAGGGGGGAASFGGAGGGLIGQDGHNGAIGGTQIAGGNSGSGAGDYLIGGSGLSLLGSNTGGGGAGYYGGGAFANSSGAGGSSYKDQLLFSISFQGPFTEDSDYQAGWAARSASTFSPGGQGGWVIRW